MFYFFFFLLSLKIMHVQCIKQQPMTDTNVVTSKKLYKIWKIHWHETECNMTIYTLIQSLPWLYKGQAHTLHTNLDYWWFNFCSCSKFALAQRLYLFKSKAPTCPQKSNNFHPDSKNMQFWWLFNGTMRFKQIAIHCKKAAVLNLEYDITSYKIVDGLYL